MIKITFTRAFAEYGTRPVNPRWAYSAIAKDGSLVLSCCWHLLKEQPNSLLRYEENLLHRHGNDRGKKLLFTHVKQAFKGNREVRLIIVTAKDPKPILAGEDASLMSKTLSVRKDLVGKVVVFDGDRFVNDFQCG